MSVDRGEWFLCAFKEMSQSKPKNAMTQGVVWTEGHGRTIVSCQREGTDVQPLHSFVGLSDKVPQIGG